MDYSVFRTRKNSLPYLWYINVDNSAAAELRANLLTGKFKEVNRFLLGLNDTNERTYYYESAADWARLPDVVSTWLNSKSEPARLASLIFATKQAWKHSPSSNNSKVSHQFSEELHRCNDGFTQFSADHPEIACQFHWHIWVARELGDPELPRQLFAESFRTAPHNKANAWASLLTEGPHWFGSLEQQYDYCRRLLPQLPDGIGSSTLLIEAHKLISDWHEEGYWNESLVKADILAAHHQCTESDFSGITGFRTLHYLAWGLVKIKAYKEAKPIFQRLQGTPPGSPWGSLRFGLDAIISPYRAARKRSLSMK